MGQRVETALVALVDDLRKTADGGGGVRASPLIFQDLSAAFQYYQPWYLSAVPLTRTTVIQ